MYDRVRSTALFAVYQLAIISGIILLPVGILAHQIGIPFPFHRVIQRVDPNEESTGE